MTIDPDNLAEGDTLRDLKQKPNQGSRIDYEVVAIEETRTFNGTETVITVRGGTVGDRDIYEKDHGHWGVV